MLSAVFDPKAVIELSLQDKQIFVVVSIRVVSQFCMNHFLHIFVLNVL